ncbi:MAG: glycosyltransferase family 39 protein [Flavobacteriales bacterium]|nr:glycosyltransferase family 39 protein [Flavobacteriales bacterium]
MQLHSFIIKWLPYLAILLVYASGANLDIMEVDAAQYASISLEMLKSGKYLQVLDRNVDYLDKPPLLFWLSALSMKLFGIGNWQYKLPSILFSLLGIFSTYKLGKRLYSEEIGRHASWIIGSSLAMMMINNDIKTDTILVSAIVFSIWMLLSYLETKQWRYLFGSAVGIAVAMLTKGPIGLMMPALAVGGHVLLKRQWKLLIDWRWVILLFLVSILLIPMSIGLYNQYGSDGLKFYFWTQSFGRITGENVWRNDTSPLFFTHIFLWSFLPWTLLGIAALLTELKNVRNGICDKSAELYLVSGIVLVWVALSLSKFKLPHYIFVVYPLIAILTAKYLHRVKHEVIWGRIQLTLSSVVTLAMASLLWYCFPNGGLWIPVLLVIISLVSSIYFFKAKGISKIVIPTFICAIAIGLGLNLHFYPQLLPYQANAQVGKWVVEKELSDNEFFGFSTGGRSLDFYAQRIIPWKQDAASTIESIHPGAVVYANEARYQELISFGMKPKRDSLLQNFEVQNLNLKFLDPKTREQALKKNYLLFY